MQLSEKQAAESPVLLLRALLFDTKRKSAKLKEIQRVFHQFDDYITKYTFTNILFILLQHVRGKGSQLSQEEEQAYIRDLYHFIDKDKNGMITYREFMQALYKSESSDIPKNIVEELKKEEQSQEKRLMSEFGKKQLFIQEMIQSSFPHEKHVDLKKMRSKILKNRTTISVNEFDFVLNRSGCNLGSLLTKADLNKSLTSQSVKNFEKDMSDYLDAEEEEMNELMQTIENDIDEMEKKESNNELLRKENNDELQKKETPEEIEKKEISEEIEKRENNEEIEKKETNEEIEEEEKQVENTLNSSRYIEPDEIVVPRSVGLNTSMETQSQSNISVAESNAADLKSKIRKMVEHTKFQAEKVKQQTQNQKKEKEDLYRQLNELAAKQEGRLIQHANELQIVKKSRQQMADYAKSLEEKVDKLESQSLGSLIRHLLDRGAVDFVQQIGARLQEEEDQKLRIQREKIEAREKARKLEESKEEDQQRPLPVYPPITEDMIAKIPELKQIKAAIQQFKQLKEETEEEMNQWKEEAAFYKEKSDRMERKLKDIKKVTEERIVEESSEMGRVNSEEDKGEVSKSKKGGLISYLNSSVSRLRDSEIDEREEITELCVSPRRQFLPHPPKGKSKFVLKKFYTEESGRGNQLSVQSGRSLEEVLSRDFANLTSLTTQRYGYKNAKFFVDQYKKNEEHLFSCKVYYFKDFKVCQKRILLIEGNHIHFFHPTSYQLIVSHPIGDIEQLLLITHSAELLMLSVKNYHPYLLQTLHRIELASFITELRKCLNMPLEPRIVEGLVLTKGGSIVDGLLPTYLAQRNKKIELSGFLGKIVRSITLSPAELKQHLLVSIMKSEKYPQNWSEKIVVLTKVGILVFENFQDQMPYCFPLVNSKLSPFEIDKLQNFPTSFAERHCEMTILKMEIEHLTSLLIAFPSEGDMAPWAEAIEAHKKSYNEEEQSILESSKLI